MKNRVASENKSVYPKINIFILTIYIDQASTLPSRSVLLLYRNQSSKLQNKSMGQFLYNGNTRLKKSNLNYRFFSVTISAATVIIKATNTARFTSSIIHMTQQLKRIQSSALKPVKLSYLVGSADRNNVYLQMICLLPKY